MKISQYKPAETIPDLAGKVILVTGGTSGIGRETILELARHNPAHIVFTGRNQTAADNVIKLSGLAPDRITFIACDMMSLASVKAGTAAILAAHDRLDICIENAGVMEFGGKATLSADGFERQWQTNYLAHALINHMLLPLMEATARTGADVRLVVVASDSHAWAPKAGVDYGSLRDPDAYGGSTGWQKRYGQSKLGNVVRANEIARRYPAITAISLHPGIIDTALARDAPRLVKTIIRVVQRPLPAKQGAFCQLWAATAPSGQVKSGAYYAPVGEVGKRSPLMTAESAAKLWDWTEETLRAWV